MKLRIQNDSLRLRLTQPEVARLAREGRVEATMHVAPGVALGYRVAAAPGDSALRAVLEGRTLTVSIPAAWVGPWAESEQVGFEGSQDAGGGRTLALLVEKDFRCLDASRDEPDAFPNPRDRAAHAA